MHGVIRIREMLLLIIILVIASANADICLTESKQQQWRTNLEFIEQTVKDLEIRPAPVSQNGNSSKVTAIILAMVKGPGLKQRIATVISIKWRRNTFRKLIVLWVIQIQIKTT
ncbi:hypothetical protein AM593_02820, partial [Mytilus galloprovincialis]